MPIQFKRSIALLFGSLLAGHSLWLMSLNKFHFGIILPCLIGMILIIYALFFHLIQTMLRRSHHLKTMYLAIWGIFWLWLISLVGFFYYLQQHTHTSTVNPEIKAILILGSGTENGKPSAILAQRLKTAAQLAQQYPRSFCIVTGGFGFGQVQSEAQVMANELIKNHQISSSRIFLENKSTSTELNLRNSQHILQNLNIDLQQPIAIVTSDFHSLRAAAIARHQGYQNIISISAPTPQYLRYNAWLREYFAYISGYVLSEY